MSIENHRIQRATKLAKLLGNPVRLRILLALREKPLCVTELMNATGRSQANVSQHLMVLRAAGMVVATRDGVRVLYRLADEKVGSLLERILDVAAISEDLDHIEGMERKPCKPRRCR
jgi:DNA-binding transcriptional ArsR family regulator